MKEKNTHIIKNRAPFLKKLVIATVAAAIGLVLFSLTLFHLVPARIYEKVLVEEFLEKTGLLLESDSFDTAFPLGFKLDGLRVANRGGNVMRLDRLRADFNPLGILTGLKVDVRGEAGKGVIEGSIISGLNSSSIDIEARGMGFSYLDALARAGLVLDGTFDSSVSIAVRGGCPNGFARLEGTELRGAELRFRGMPLPFDGIDEAGFSADLKDCSIRLNGLWIDGAQISMRLLGDIRISRPLSESPVDMTIEIVPHGDLLEKQYMLSPIANYRKSANFYSIPLKGTLGGLSSGL
ncbi:MAG TPA: type II secretion system protein GspN [Deltaproteobacteria bacterium]|nr:MAG: type II secretion system protein GspN [Deltaproteobacteria bacterium GWA2_55_82]OGQ62961.1 MAG: type II secretion system protein GspN [Deltaproteobacteria bacterium RIFCSPLOWO2_02_FULL_55_12]OIJ72924.1 MAG: type II secretion system protein GspN [Deltaproteobacteria bacterium GWC2_55_46]HBG46072.1 type II secretion system protein GspN [Deltaproteobacteria bacterium]HCY11710.1 type II secretion system protein GspN [Deltaproteobacteria bacterium]